MLVIGHRGCRGLLPENTIVSFKEAIRLGVDAIELDVVVSGDHQIVVSHEPFMSQLTCLKPDGSSISKEEDQFFNLYNMSYEEIETFDCGIKPNYKFPEQRSVMAVKPLLNDTIRSCEEFIDQKKLKPIDYIIEIKSREDFYGKFYPDPSFYVELLLTTLASLQLKGRIILKSFDVNILNEIKRRQPHQKVSLLVNKDEKISQKLALLEFRPEIIGPYFELLDESEVRLYRSLGYDLLPWTINAPTDMKRLLQMNVDGIITDYPDRLIAIVQENKVYS